MGQPLDGQLHRVLDKSNPQHHNYLIAETPGSSLSSVRTDIPLLISCSNYPRKPRPILPAQQLPQQPSWNREPCLISLRLSEVDIFPDELCPITYRKAFFLLALPIRGDDSISRSKNNDNRATTTTTKPTTNHSNRPFFRAAGGKELCL